ncbi:hypothetical protein GCM10025773_14580 [Microbacterium jejuense]
MLLLHDAAAVAELGERLGEAASETRAHTSCEDDGLKGQNLLLKCVIHCRFTGATPLRAWTRVSKATGKVQNERLPLPFRDITRMLRLGDTICHAIRPA